MSQHMEFDEANRQQQEPHYTAGYGDPFLSSDERLKLSSQHSGCGGGIPAGMRLALAIVSVCILIPISAIALTTGDGGVGLIKGLIGLGMACLTIMIVNIVFNVSKH